MIQQDLLSEWLETSVLEWNFSVVMPFAMRNIWFNYKTAVTFRGAVLKMWNTHQVFWDWTFTKNNCDNFHFLLNSFGFELTILKSCAELNYYLNQDWLVC